MLFTNVKTKQQDDSLNSQVLNNDLTELLKSEYSNTINLNDEKLFQFEKINSLQEWLNNIIIKSFNFFLISLWVNFFSKIFFNNISTLFHFSGIHDSILIYHSNFFLSYKYKNKNFKKMFMYILQYWLGWLIGSIFAFVINWICYYYWQENALVVMTIYNLFLVFFYFWFSKVNFNPYHKKNLRARFNIKRKILFVVLLLFLLFFLIGILIWFFLVQKNVNSSSFFIDKNKLLFLKDNNLQEIDKWLKNQYPAIGVNGIFLLLSFVMGFTFCWLGISFLIWFKIVNLWTEFYYLLTHHSNSLLFIGIILAIIFGFILGLLFYCFVFRFIYLKQPKTQNHLTWATLIASSIFQIVFLVKILKYKNWNWIDYITIICVLLILLFISFLFLYLFFFYDKKQKHKFVLQKIIQLLK